MMILIISIEKDAFKENKLEEVTILHDETVIGQGVFSLNQSTPSHLTIFDYVPSTAETYTDNNAYTAIQKRI